MVTGCWQLEHWWEIKIFLYFCTGDKNLSVHHCAWERCGAVSARQAGPILKRGPWGGL